MDVQPTIQLKAESLSPKLPVAFEWRAEVRRLIGNPMSEAPPADGGVFDEWTMPTREIISYSSIHRPPPSRSAPFAFCPCTSYIFTVETSTFSNSPTNHAMNLTLSHMMQGRSLISIVFCFEAHVSM